jgi:hypothetical protein
MPPLRGVIANVKDRRGNVKPGRFCVLRSYFGGGRDILVYLMRWTPAGNMCCCYWNDLALSAENGGVQIVGQRRQCGALFTFVG